MKRLTSPTMNKIPDTDAYIGQFPKETQKRLVQLRKTIRKAAPMAEECISYQMPAYKYKGMVAYFAGYKKHIGFYPTASAIEAFQEDIQKFKRAKGSVQFPLDKALPLELIRAMIRFKIDENEQKATAGKLKKMAGGKQKTGNFPGLSAPAQRALQNSGIFDLRKLSTYSEAEVLSLHGIGPTTLPKLRATLKTAGLSFRN